MCMSKVGLSSTPFFLVVTMATVRYGNGVSITTAGKLFTIGFTVAGLGIFVATVTAIVSIFISNFFVRK